MTELTNEAAIRRWSTMPRSLVKQMQDDGDFCKRPWREHGEYRIREYFDECEIEGPYGSDFHRPMAAYLNELIKLGCRLTEIVEPRLDSEVAAHGPDGIQAYVSLPNFLVVAARTDELTSL